MKAARTDFAQVDVATDARSQLALAETWVAMQQIDRVPPGIHHMPVVHPDARDVGQIQHA